MPCKVFPRWGDSRTDAIVIGKGVGGSVQMSVCRGTGSCDKANRFFTLSFFTLGVISVILWLVYGLNISSMLRLMGANETLHPYAMAYMKYINIFLPIAVFSNYFAIFVRADGDPNRAMLGVMLGGAANIVLDIVFVFPLIFDGDSLWIVMPVVETVVLVVSLIFLHGEEIVYRNAIGITKKYTFNDITEIRQNKKGRVVVFMEKRKIFAIDDFLPFGSLFVALARQRGIQINKIKEKN